MKNEIKRGGLSAQSRVGWPPSLTGKERRESDTGHGTRNKERTREKGRDSERKPGF